MPAPIIYAYGQPVEIDNAAFTPIEVGNNSAGAEDFPTKGMLDHVNLRLAAIAGGATQVTWYLSYDEDGDIPITPVVTQTITLGATDPTSGACVANVKARYQIPGDATKHICWLQAMTNAGTCDCAPYVYVER